MWHYRDPSGKVQGPFSMVQLRKWNKSGYFPSELRIWKASENQDDSILLTDALAGKIQKEPPVPDNSFGKVQTMNSPNFSSYSGKPHGSTLQQGHEGRGGERSHLDQNCVAWNPHGTLASSGRSADESWRPEQESTSMKGIAAPSVDIPKWSAGGLGSDYSRTNLTNLPSPTPNQSTPGGTAEQAYENKWSPTSFPVQSSGPVLGANQFPGGSRLLHAAVRKVSGQLAESGPATSGVLPAVDGSNMPQGAFSHQTNAPGNKVQNVMEYLGAIVPPNFGGQSMRSAESETKSSQMQSQSVAPGESHRVQVNANLLQAPNASEASSSSGADLKNAGASLQNLIQSVSSHVSPAGARGWDSGVVAKPESIPSVPVAGSDLQDWASATSQKLEPNNMIPQSVQPTSYGHYVNAPSSAHNSASSFSAGNPTGVFHASGFSGLPQSSNPWRPPISAHQSNNMPSVAAHQPNNMPSVAAHQQNNMPSVGAPQPNNMPSVGAPQPNNMPSVGAHQPNHQHSGAPNPPWVGPIPGNPNMGWMGPAPGNINWGPPGQGQTAGNANPGWAPLGQGPAPGNTNSGWAVAGQGPPPVNGNPGMIAPGQGLLPGNSKPGWTAPTQSHNGDRFSGQRDSGYGGGKPWNRQSSFGNGGGGGGGGSRPRVCRFHENGHCKKGSSCNYMHN